MSASKRERRGTPPSHGEIATFSVSLFDNKQTAASPLMPSPLLSSAGLSSPLLPSPLPSAPPLSSANSAKRPNSATTTTTTVSTASTTAQRGIRLSSATAKTVLRLNASMTPAALPPTVPLTRMPLDNTTATATATATPHSTHRQRTTSHVTGSPAVFSRVRVAVRCRPPFPEEGSAAQIAVLPPGYVTQAALPNADLPSLANVSKALQVDIAPGKRREFGFDVVFGPNASNTDVYNVIGGPVVDGVLKGINGTILAYGQTGSGKTHSLGILTRVSGESGIIPRSLSHIFGAIALAQSGAAPAPSHVVTMSFAQLYLDTVQDLLVPTAAGAPPGHNINNSAAGDMSGSASVNTSFNDAASVGSGSTQPFRRDRGDRDKRSEDYGGSLAATGPGLAVREDPSRGFYVEGLSEYCVKSFAEACTLLNWGLENRILGATRMNSTSSRSHTILTVRVETREPVAIPESEGTDGDPSYGYVSRKSQLMLCDLAGSERVRRTSSRGARLEEARAINASLHTLGQVIAALSSISTQHSGMAPRVHVPWRDSKLTRLLYGNLGGSSNTFLLATVGPGIQNVSESLSTLLFASRCMRVSAQPVMASAMGNYSNADYADLCARLQGRLSTIEAGHAIEMAALVNRYEMAMKEMAGRLDSVVIQRNEAFSRDSGAAYRILQQALPESPVFTGPSEITKYMYQSFLQAYHSSLAAVLSVLYRAGRHAKSWERAVARAADEEEVARAAKEEMLRNDPQFLQLQRHNAGAGSVPAAPHPDSYGPHLGHAYKSAAAALATVHLTHASNHLVSAAAAHNAEKKLGVLASASSDGHCTSEADGHCNTEFSGLEERQALSALSAVTPASQVPVSDLLAPPFTPLHVTLSDLAIAIVTGHIHSPDFRLRFAASNSAQSLDQDGDTDSEDDNHSQLDAADEDMELPVSSTTVLSSLAAAMLGVTSTDGPSTEQPFPLAFFPSFAAFDTPERLSQFVESVLSATKGNMARLNAVAAVKDARFDEVKRHLAAAEAAVRVRDEDAANQRYVLRYLVDTTGNLRDEARKLRHALSRERSKSSRMSEAFSLGTSPKASPVPSIASSRRDSLAEVNRSLDDSLSQQAGISDTRGTPSMVEEDDWTWELDDALVGNNTPVESKAAFSKLLQRQTETSKSLPGDRRGIQMEISHKPTVHAAITANAFTTTSNPIATPRAAVLPEAEQAPMRAQPLVDVAGSTIASKVPVSSVPTPSGRTNPPPHPSKALVADEEDDDDPTGEKYDSFDYADELDGQMPGEDEVEYIVAHKTVPPTKQKPLGCVLYRVHWRGTTPADDEWFDREDLLSDFPRVVREYESRNKMLPLLR